ncbi:MULTISPECIES: 3'-5' exonuclease [unclassified Acinetobacter]|uniref:3'-5' exonuclease n=1 Tax=unclassified Acinetobacter TaxID=196816 RepID=UPI002934FFA5|nr:MULTISPECIES: 3'-5' exonuclease [unclassified Acinetobacter]WOE32784.1 3'-5' exonuclease [Acinetobacter sp. SAAs470]WOE38261.1 3'-5' exonuclease [Acinetobacter sp. SAAs474]
MNAVILDTETHALNGYPIEIAYMPCSFEQGMLVADINQAFDEFFSCPEPISLGAKATHHILESDIAQKPSYEVFRLPNTVQYMIGHNIDYDIQAVKLCDPSIDVKSICTLALARMAWKNLDSHTLGALYYNVMKDQEKARKHLQHAHNAKADIYFTGVILKALVECLGIKDMNSLHLISETARIPKEISFGKHKGTALKDLEKSYVSWLLKQPELDKYLRKALEAL